MKLQDILFLLLMVLLFYKNRYEYFVWSGLLCLILSIPLFSFWIFFTAERLVTYGFFLFLIASLLFLTRKR